MSHFEIIKVECRNKTHFKPEVNDSITYTVHQNFVQLFFFSFSKKKSYGKTHDIRKAQN